jgi:hypothetical protein
MLPVVDYGSIAIVVPKVAAVGGVELSEDRYGFEVFLQGINDPFVVNFSSREEAESSRADLVSVIAQYHYMTEMGPDFDVDDIMDSFPEDEYDGSDEGSSEH